VTAVPHRKGMIRFKKRHRPTCPPHCTPSVAGLIFGGVLIPHLSGDRFLAAFSRPAIDGRKAYQ